MKENNKIFCFALIINVSLFFYGCKKNNNDSDCECNSYFIKYSLKEKTGTLVFFENKNRWIISYKPLQGNISNYFPCKTDQDSLQRITQNANKNETFNVKFSGKVKSTCPDESFGITNGVTTFDYIILDSLKIN